MEAILLSGHRCRMPVVSTSSGWWLAGTLKFLRMVATTLVVVVIWLWLTLTFMIRDVGPICCRSCRYRVAAAGVDLNLRLMSSGDVLEWTLCLVRQAT